MTGDGDERLRDLHEQKISLENQITKRKIEIAREKGEIVDSLDELKCREHNERQLVAVGEIPESRIFSRDRSALKIYACPDCNPFSRALVKGGYDCQECGGIVKGEFKTVPYSSSKESWLSLAGREGEHYYCRVCDSQLGQNYWKFS
jgi:hypothetical protein